MKKTAFELLVFASIMCLPITLFAIEKSDPNTFLNQASPFIKNMGQIHDQNGLESTTIQYYRSFAEYDVFLKKNGMSFQIQKLIDENRQASARIEFNRIDLEFINANDLSQFKSEDQQASVSHFYNSSDGENYLNVPHYGILSQKQIFDGIDLKYYDQGGQLEYDFIVSPYASVDQIAMEVKGSKNLFIGSNGELIIETEIGKVVQQKPIAYQDETEISASWAVKDNYISFELGDYDPSKELVIDPVVQVWGTYFGGPSGETGSAIEIDGQKVYIVGSTRSSSNIATTGAHQTSIGSTTNADAFLACFDLNGSLNWASYYGGSDSDGAIDCKVDKDHNIYMIGQTRSSNGIATSGAHQNSKGGNLDDIFLVKFDSSGKRLWGTYFGDLDRDFGTSLAVDSNSNIYITAQTRSDSMATSGAYQTLNAGDYDILLAKFDSTGSLQWSTYYGGSNADNPYDIKLDDSLNIYITGSLSSTGLATAGSHDQSLGGTSDGFLCKFSNSGNLVWFTYFGGPGYDISNALDINSSGDIVFVGNTGSTSDIASSGAFQDTLNGLQDNYVAKFNSSGNRIWSSYYGGNNAEQGNCVMVDASDDIYFGGMSNSTSLFGTNGVHQDTLGGTLDATLIKFSNAGMLQWATYFGTSGNGYTNGITLDAFNLIYIVGSTSGSTGYATSGTHQSTSNGLNEAFISKFYDCANGSFVELSACDSVQKPNSNFWWTKSTTDQDTFTNAANCDSLVIYEITVLPSQIQQRSDSACDRFISVTGKDYTTSGIYRDTLTNVLGCDSIIELDLTIITIDTSVNVNNNELNAAAANKLYQWLDCEDNFAEIPGATGQTYQPSANGSYAVAISEGGCVDTSTCFDITTLNLLESEPNGFFEVYPNPSSGILTIELDRESTGELFLLSSKGVQVYTQNFSQEKNIVIDLPKNHSNGIYFLQVQSSDGVFKEKVVVRR